MIFNGILKMWVALKTSKKGQAMTEYGLVIALIAVAVIVALAALGGKLSELFELITDSLTGGA